MNNDIYYRHDNFYLSNIVESSNILTSYGVKGNIFSFESEERVNKYFFNKSTNLKLRKISQMMNIWNSIGKKIYKNNFWMSDECFNPSPYQLLTNLIRGKCYIAIRFPNKITTVYDGKGIKTPFTMPLKDMYVFIPFRIRKHKNNVPILCLYHSIFGFQAGFDKQRSLLYPHLRGNNDRFCLGESELDTLISLLNNNDIADDDFSDVFEIMLDYIDIMLGCQSNEGGPYRKIEHNIYNIRQIRKTSYFHNIITFYFLCVPREEWVVNIISNKLITKDDYCIIHDLIIEDFDKLFKQLKKYLPKKYQFDIRNVDFSLNINKDFPIEMSEFRFKNKYIKTYIYDSQDIGYYNPNDKKEKKNKFLNDEFKEEFVNYFINLNYQLA